MNKSWTKYQPHESAVSHVTGEAKYVSDIQLHNNLLWGQAYFSPKAHAIIKSYDLSEALKTEGIVDIIDFTRIPGINQLNAFSHDELCLAEGKVTYIGQAIFLIAAKNRETALKAAKKIHIAFEELEAIFTIEDAMAKSNSLAPARRIETGNPDEAMKSAQFRLKGTLSTGAQEHWYLETQSAMCVPGENRNMTVYASSQNPAETQNVVAEVLGLQSNQVICEVKRMGGGFGGKETQANPIAAWAALLADATRQPVLMQLSRDEDQKVTGKRHPFLSNYEIGFDGNGIISAYSVDLHGNAGSSIDLSIPILERAMYHTDSSYFIENMRVTGTMWKTNLPSNTAFRGFGGPQGMAVIENAIDRIARFLGKDAAEIRFKNFYQTQTKNLTHYGQMVKNNRLLSLWDQLIKSSDYFERREIIEKFNHSNNLIKKGIALTPVKFGISFTTAFLNQAGALILVYKDGSVMVNHGGTEMGQGLHTKILQIAAKELGISKENITISPTNTSKVPNSSATAASSGTDLNGMAVKDAIRTIKNRLKPLAYKLLLTKCPTIKHNEIIFKDTLIFPKSNPEITISFAELAKKAHLEQISLSATGYYGTPDIYFDREKGKGKPFHYYAFGMAVSEVEVDILTGISRLIQTDILHDAGKSIHPEIDKGQIMGAFMQGVGWCTTEVIRWDTKGNLLNCSPDTYKIPGIGDFPGKYKAELLKNANNSNAIHQSKAIGEPPFMLAFSVWLAIKDAISSVANHTKEPDFSLPATKEVVLMSIKKLKESL
jgi:xanthine dehydrogenase molybdopterin binding subunit